MAKKYLDDAGVLYFWQKLKNYFQPKLVSGTNRKTINNETLLGSGNIDTGGGSGLNNIADTNNGVAVTGDTETSGKFYFGNGIELRGVKYATADSPAINISASNTGTFTATYTLPSGYTSALLTGLNLRATGTNYNRVFTYGGESSVSNGVCTLTCYGRNTYTSAANNLSVRFRLLLLTPLDN